MSVLRHSEQTTSSWVAQATMSGRSNSCRQRVWRAVAGLLELAVAPTRVHLSQTTPGNTYERSSEANPVANIKSQIKRINTNEKARQRNKAVKSALRTHTRRFREAAAAGDVEKAQEYARTANRALDKAASKGVIHKNQAANRKSAIAAQAAKLG